MRRRKREPGPAMYPAGDSPSRSDGRRGFLLGVAPCTPAWCLGHQGKPPVLR